MDRADHVLRIGGSIDLRDVQMAVRDGVRKGAVEIFFVQQDALENVLERTRNRLSLTLNEEQYVELVPGARPTSDTDRPHFEIYSPPSLSRKLWQEERGGLISKSALSN